MAQLGDKYREVEGSDDRTPNERLEWNQYRTREITQDDWAAGCNALVESERIVDILPASAKRLRLVGGLSNEGANAMLAEIMELKDKCTRNLWRIFFEDVCMILHPRFRARVRRRASRRCSAEGSDFRESCLQI